MTDNKNFVTIIMNICSKVSSPLTVNWKLYINKGNYVHNYLYKLMIWYTIALPHILYLFFFNFLENM